VKDAKMDDKITNDKRQFYILEGSCWKPILITGLKFGDVFMIADPKGIIVDPGNDSIFMAAGPAYINDSGILAINYIGVTSLLSGALPPDA